MSIIRINKNKNYTVISNYHLKEKNMSLKAKGLLSLMLSLPDDWDYSIAGLVAISKENETSIKNTLNELKKFGYLKVIKLMPNESKNGRIEYRYDVYEKAKQEDKKQGVENLCLEFLGVENQGQLNTNNKNTKELNTKQLTIYDFVEQNFGRTLTSIEVQSIQSWLLLYNEEIIKYAIELAVKQGKRTFAYVEGILKNWKGCNYQTVEEIMEQKKVEEDPYAGIQHC